MHVILMLGVLSTVFFLAMFLMCLYRNRLNSRLISVCFVIACAVFYLCWNYAAYEQRNGLKNGFITLENISPYICAVIIATPFLNETIRKFAYCAIAFLSFGMVLAMFISPEVEYLVNYRSSVSFTYMSEAACHLAMALYGYYLVLSGKVKLTLVNYLKSIAFMFASIGFGVFLNWIFHLSNFGMNMHGKYSIYFLDIFFSFEITFFAYIVGVLGTLTLGFIVCMFVDWLARPKNKHPKNSDSSVKLELK